MKNNIIIYICGYTIPEGEMGEADCVKEIQLHAGAFPAVVGRTAEIEAGFAAEHCPTACVAPEHETRESQSVR